MTTYCKRFPIRLIKTVRLRFRSIWQLMERLKDLMVIALFRDPRGMLNSRYVIVQVIAPKASTKIFGGLKIS